ncbi:MAG: ABC transporter substrate-binding protein [Actinomycetota bacterium]
MLNNLRHRAAASALAALLVLATGCGGDEGDGAASAPTEAATGTADAGAATDAATTGDESDAGGTAEAGSDDGASSDVRTVEHALGTSEVPAVPQRIISMDSIVTLDGLVALDAFDQVVGRVNISGSDNPYWLDVDVESVPMLGTWPNLSTEEILAADPDLVVGFQTALEALDPQTAEVVPLVAVAPTEGPTNPRWQDTLTGLGTALDREDEANALIADYDARVDEVVTDLPDGFAGRTVLILLGQAGVAGAAMGPSAAPAELFDRLGLEVSPQLDGQGDFVPLTEEQVPGLEADIVLMLDFDDGATDWDQIFAELPAFAANPSIAEGVTVVDGNLWLNAGPIGQLLLLDEAVEVLAP